jgi:hypothetical protein
MSALRFWASALRHSPTARRELLVVAALLPLGYVVLVGLVLAVSS